MNSTASLRGAETKIRAVQRRSEARWSRMMPEAVKRRAKVNLGWLGVKRLEGPCAILSKWFLPTRLETRTKESKTNASMVVEKPTCEMKVNDAKRKQQHRPTMIQW
jgi:hypothetical protein